MSESRNTIEFRVWGKYALFTDPITKIGGEKFSYQIPTYEAMKGVCKSIYWKPTIVWVVDELRVMRKIQTQTKGTKPQEFSGGNTLAYYTFLRDVEYQVRAHFEWNEHRTELKQDRDPIKHYAMAQKALRRGGRQDVFLGTRDCQGYVEPCAFNTGAGELDGAGELGFGVMFHGFDYPDESGDTKLHARFWRPALKDGRLKFAPPKACEVRKFVREMTVKPFGLGVNQQAIESDPDAASEAAV